MSKSRQRLESFRETVKKKRPPVEPLNFNEKLKIAVIVVFGFLSLLAIPLLNSRSEHHRLIEKRLRAWGSELGLSEVELKNLSKIEFSFHGTGNPFSNKPNRTRHEWREHRKQLAAAVEPSIQQQFLLVLERH